MTALSLNLDQFKGPLELLIHLIQRREVNPSSLEMGAILKAFFESEGADFDFSSDFILLASQVALLKSRSLLPRQKNEDEELLSEEALSPSDLIPHLIDYCRFKEAAEEFSKWEVKQSTLFTRGVPEEEGRLPPGLAGITLEELGGLFQEALKKAACNVGKIEEEEWRVQDKIASIRLLIRRVNSLPFLSLFEHSSYKVEMIVIFLALLELIKNGEVKVAKEEEVIKIYGA
jgi:segregation and condensation protein A